MAKYKLAVGSLFKNETGSMKEWLEHYIARGVEHFYLVNDKSTDDYMSVLGPYIERGVVTIFEEDCPYYLGRQRDIYNRWILPRLGEMEWLIMIDMDEYMWSPKYTNLYNLLMQFFKDIAQIQVNHTVFGSNGHEEQPSSLVAGFTKRSKEVPSVMKYYKYIINTRYSFTCLNIHHATHGNHEDQQERFKIFSPEWFRLNHYSCQSREFWRDVKCTRGDADNYRNRGVDDAYWKEIDLNEVEDLELYEQNHRLGLC
jgi:hypothetical protein